MGYLFYSWAFIPLPCHLSLSLSVHFHLKNVKEEQKEFIDTRLREYGHEITDLLKVQ